MLVLLCVPLLMFLTVSAVSVNNSKLKRGEKIREKQRSVLPSVVGSALALDP